MTPVIRDATVADAAAIAEIYSHYALNTVVTFEESAVSEDTIAARISAVQESGRPWLVIEDDARVMGYANVSPFASKPAYRHTVETSVYTAPSALGRGLGRQIFKALLDRLANTDARSAVSLIALPNEPSERLHRDLGFERVGVLRDAGFKFETWVDVAHWQLMLHKSGQDTHPW